MILVANLVVKTLIPLIPIFGSQKKFPDVGKFPGSNSMHARNSIPGVYQNFVCFVYSCFTEPVFLSSRYRFNLFRLLANHLYRLLTICTVNAGKLDRNVHVHVKIHSEWLKNRMGTNQRWRPAVKGRACICITGFLMIIF